MRSTWTALTALIIEKVAAHYLPYRFGDSGDRGNSVSVSHFILDMNTSLVYIARAVCFGRPGVRGLQDSVQSSPKPMIRFVF